MNHDEVLMLAEQRPPALPVPMFPLVSQITAGISGVWVLGGESDVGKTTFTRHLVYNVVGPDLRVAYLDTEGHFFDKGANAGIMACHDSGLRERARDYMSVFQDSDEFRAHVGALPVRRALIVIDHIQLEAERSSSGGDSFHQIDGVMKVAIDWSNAGHIVLVLSQVPRNFYGRAPTKSVFKGRSSLEAGATIGAALWRPEKGNDDLLQFVVVKPRYIPKPKVAVNLVREGWCLREVGPVPVGEEREARSPRRKKHRYEIVLDRAYGEAQVTTNTAIVRAFQRAEKVSERTAQSRVKECITLKFIQPIEDGDDKGKYRRVGEREGVSPSASGSGS